MSENGYKIWAPSVLIEPDTYRRMMAFTKHADGEVSGLMYADLLDDGKTMYISNYLLFEQEASSGGVDFDVEAFASFMDQAMQDDSIDLGRLRCWHHSHANIGVMWSGTDWDCCEMLVTNAPFYVSIVTNKRGEVLVRMDWGQNERGPRMTLDNVGWTVGVPEEPDMEDAIKAELREKVKKHVVSTSGKAKGSSSGGWDDGWGGHWEHDRRVSSVPISSRQEKLDYYGLLTKHDEKWERSPVLETEATRWEQSADRYKDCEEGLFWEVYSYLRMKGFDKRTAAQDQLLVQVEEWLDEATSGLSRANADGLKELEGELDEVEQEAAEEALILARHNEGNHSRCLYVDCQLAEGEKPNVKGGKK